MKTEYYNGILCIEAGWLCENIECEACKGKGCSVCRGKGIVPRFFSLTNYCNMVNAKINNGKPVLNVVRRGCKGTPALVEFASIPERYRKPLIEKHGDPAEVTALMHFEKHIVQDVAAMAFFSTWELPDGRNLKPEVIKEYYTNATVLNAMQEVLTNRKARRRSLGITKGAWLTVAKTVFELDRKKHPHELPANEASLRRLFNRYVKGGYIELIHGNYCNDNSRKVHADLERLIISIYCMDEKPYVNWVVDEYLRFLSGETEIIDTKTGEYFDRKKFFNADGTPIVISESTVWNYVNKPTNKIIIDALRMSRHKFNSTVRPHHHRESAKLAFSKISLDDRDLPRKMHGGGRVKAYYAYDVASGALIGAAYSIKKDANLFIECIRDMFRFCDRHGYGTPIEMQVEHHIVSLFKDDLMKAGIVFPFVQFCAPGNSQEKHAEHFIKAKKYGFEKKYQTGIGRFYLKRESNQTGGERVYDEKTDKYIIKEKTYDYNELIADDRDTIEKYNNSLHRNQKLYPGKTCIEVLHENMNPNVREINRPFLYRYIGEMTKTSLQRNHYAQVQYCDYGLPAPEYLNRLAPADYDLQAYWLPDAVTGEIDSVYLYQNDNFICEAKKIKTYNTATAEQTDADTEIYTEQAKYVAQFDAQVKRGKETVAKVTIIENNIDYKQITPETVIPKNVFDNSAADFEADYDSEYIAARALADL